MRVLVVKLSSLGDILHVLPAVLAIKAQTGADIDWAVHPEFAGIVRTFKCVRRTILFPRHGILRALPHALHELRSERYDLVLDFHGLLKSAVVARLALLAPGGRRIAPSYAREGSCLFFGERAGRLHRDCHAAIQAYDTLDYLGLARPATTATSPADFILPPCDHISNLKSQISNLKSQIPNSTSLADGTGSSSAQFPLVAIAPVSRWPSKNWPAANFARFASLLSAALPEARFAVIGGPADRDVGASVASALGDRIANLCGATSIPQTMAILARCHLLVANDSGPVHMAAAVGTPCLVLFGPTRPGWTGPLGDGHRIISAGLDCQPCLKHRCPRGDNPCMAAISPESVRDAALEMLNLHADHIPDSGNRRLNPTGPDLPLSHPAHPTST